MRLRVSVRSATSWRSQSASNSALRRSRVHQRVSLGVVAAAVDRAQVGDVTARVGGVVGLRIALARRRVGEPLGDDVAAGKGAQQGLGKRVLPQHGAEVVGDLGGRVEPVEHAHQRGADVAGAVPARRRDVAGELEEMVALVLREPQRAGDRGHHRLRRTRAAALLEPRVEVGRHARQRGDLLAPQSRGSPARAGAEADVLRPQRLTAAAQEVGESVAVHGFASIERSAAGIQGRVVPGSIRLWSVGVAAASVGSMLALITGANRGIGRSAALQLAREGVDIVLTYRTHADEAAAVVAEIEALGRTARALQLDTGDVASFPGLRRGARRHPDRLPRQQRRDVDRRRVRGGRRGRFRPPRRRALQGRLLPHPGAAPVARRRRGDRQPLDRPDPLHRTAARCLRLGQGRSRYGRGPSTPPSDPAIRDRFRPVAAPGHERTRSAQDLPATPAPADR